MRGVMLRKAGSDLASVATLCACFLLLLPHLAHATKRAAEWIDLARLEASDGRHEAALTAIDSALVLNPGDFDARLLRARVLSWQGRFGAADIAYRELLTERPADADARLGFSLLRYYEGRLDEAAVVLNGLLAENPANTDVVEAQTLVEKARMAQNEKPAVRRWRVDAGGEYSTFTRTVADLPTWNQQFVQVGRRLDDGSAPLSVFGRVERFERYDLTDWALEAGVARTFFPGLYGSFTAGFSPDAVFRPQWRVAADAEYQIRKASGPQDAIPSVWALGTARYDAYESAEFLGLSPGVRTEWGPWATTGRLAHVREVGGEVLTGWSLRFDGVTGSPSFGPVRENIRFLAGIADAPETEVRGATAVTISTMTLFAGVALDFEREWTLNLGYARDDRENSWVRHSVNVGVARGF